MPNCRKNVGWPKERYSVIGKKREISDRDINTIKQLKNEGKSYSYISKQTGCSKATISRVINNKKGFY